jgi:hypothetical protein
VNPFLGLGLNKLELSVALARSCLYLRMKQQENPAYVAIASLLENLATETLNQFLTNAPSTEG